MTKPSKSPRLVYLAQRHSDLLREPLSDHEGSVHCPCRIAVEIRALEAEERASRKSAPPTLTQRVAALEMQVEEMKDVLKSRATEQAVRAAAAKERGE